MSVHITTDPRQRRTGYVYDKDGVGQADERPTLVSSDGRVHVLTLWERVQLQLGLTDIHALDRKHRRRA